MFIVVCVENARHAPELASAVVAIEQQQQQSVQLFDDACEYTMTNMRRQWKIFCTKL